MENIHHEISVEEEIVGETDESEEVSPFRYEITAYGADYPVDALVKRIASGDITVPTFDPKEEF